MAQRTCSVDGCDKPHGARGFCYPHYGTWHRQTFGRKQHRFTVACLGCGEQAEVSTPTGKYCSDLCQGYHRFGPQSCKWTPPKPPQPPKPEPFFAERTCGWCEAEFVATVRTQVFCCADHKQHAKRTRRRGRQYGWASHFTWAEFMRVFLRFDRCCAYCEQHIEGQPEPDHVVPLAQGGSNSITNILPSCSACNSDKRDLSLADWNDDRRRRGLALRMTAWHTDDQRVTHLTCLAA